MQVIMHSSRIRARTHAHTVHSMHSMHLFAKATFEHNIQFTILFLSLISTRDWINVLYQIQIPISHPRRCHRFFLFLQTRTSESKYDMYDIYDYALITHVWHVEINKKRDWSEAHRVSLAHLMTKNSYKCQNRANAFEYQVLSQKMHRKVQKTKRALKIDLNAQRSRCIVMKWYASHAISLST